jgi:hypothetical protein
VKGELERDVRKIGFRSLTILRPSIIEGERDEVRLGESLVLKLSHFLAPVLPKRFHVNPAPKIAQVLVDAVVTAEPGCLFKYSDSLVWQVVPIGGDISWHKGIVFISEVFRFEVLGFEQVDEDFYKIYFRDVW